jgi:hypothetical protein
VAIKVKDPILTAALEGTKYKRQIFEYDYNGNIILRRGLTSKYSNSNSWETWRYTYDTDGNLTEITFDVEKWE